LQNSRLGHADPRALRRRLGHQRPRALHRERPVHGRRDPRASCLPHRRGRPRGGKRRSEAGARAADPAADPRHLRLLLPPDQRRHGRARRLDRARLHRARLLDVRRRRHHRLDRQLGRDRIRRPDGRRPSPRLLAGVLSFQAALPRILRVLRRSLPAVALAALACALTACGVRNSVDPVASAATKSEQAGGYQVAMTVTTSTGGAQQIAMTGRGTFGQDEGELEVTLAGLMGSVLGGLSGGSGTDATMKAVYLTEDGDPVVYMNLGFLSSFLPGGKPWVRLDIAKAGKTAGVDLSQLLGGAGQNPSDWLGLLESQGDFSEAGRETLDGVDATRLHRTVHPPQAARS